MLGNLGEGGAAGRSGQAGVTAFRIMATRADENNRNRRCHSSSHQAQIDSPTLEKERFSNCSINAPFPLPDDTNLIAKWCAAP